MNKKIINNAISAYFGLGVLLLLPSKKENINHPFVKKHAKTASFIHCIMFINYIVFISYSLGGSISIIPGYGLNHIVASIFFLGLFGWLLYGISKAGKGDDFSINDMANMSKADKMIEFRQSNLNEQGIVTIILSLVPFLGFILKGKFKNYKSPIIESNIKLNFIITFIISIFFILKDNNIGLLLILFYTMFIVFYSILVITKQHLITLKLEKIYNIEDLYIFIITLVKYIFSYFKGKTFRGISEVKKEVIEEKIKKDTENKHILQEKKQAKLSKIWYYIPYINIIGLIDAKSQYKFHVINGLCITLLSGLLWYFGYNHYQLLLIFLIFYGIGYTKIIEYRFPILFDIYSFFEFLFGKIFRIGTTVQQKHKEVQEVTFTNSDI